MITKFLDFLSTQAWFQELKSKWENLDASLQLYVKAGSAGSVVLALIVVIVSYGVKTYQLKSEFKNKQELLGLLTQAIEEIKPQNNENEPSGSSSGVQWKRQLESVIESASITTPQIEWKDEKRIASNNSAQLETWLEFKLNDIELKQIVKLSVNIETHLPPLKMRLLEIDSTKTKGKLVAHIAVSGFEVK